MLLTTASVDNSWEDVIAIRFNIQDENGIDASTVLDEFSVGTLFIYNSESVGGADVSPPAFGQYNILNTGSHLNTGLGPASNEAYEWTTANSQLQFVTSSGQFDDTNIASVCFYENLIIPIGGGGDADCATEVKVSSQSYDDTEIFKGIFATQSDGSCTTVSASDDFFIDGIDGGGYDAANSQEFIFGDVEGDSTHALVSRAAIRQQSGSFTDAGSGTVNNIYKYNWIQNSYLASPSLGQQDIITLKVPRTVLRDSDDYHFVFSSSFDYMRIHHTITTTPISPVARSQAFVHTVMWTRVGMQGAGVAEDLTFNTVEDVRFPVNGLLISPSATTGSFDADGNLVISVYHYVVAGCNHMFDFETIGNINKVGT